MVRADGCTTNPARFAFSPIHRQQRLKISLRSVNAPKGVHRCSVVGNGLLKHLLARTMDSMNLRPTQDMCFFPRRDSRFEKNFIRVNVADPRHDTLIHEHGLDHPFRSRNGIAKLLNGDRQSIRTKSFRPKTFLPLGSIQQHDFAESPRINEPKFLSRMRQFNANMRVRWFRAMAITNRDSPGHPQVKHQDSLPIESGEHPLALTINALNPCTLDGR
jgi:hypothetical protein